MSLRSLRERAIQTIAFEIGGIVIATPLYAVLFGAQIESSLLLVTALSVAVLLWSPLHNTVFDMADLSLSGRLASDRPHGLRIVHAISHELASLVVTLPILVFLGGHSLFEAILLDLGLTALFAIYAYFFNLFYDRLRPVQPSRRET